MRFSVIVNANICLSFAVLWNLRYMEHVIFSVLLFNLSTHFYLNVRYKPGWPSRAMRVARSTDARETPTACAAA